MLKPKNDILAAARKIGKELNRQEQQPQPERWLSRVLRIVRLIPKKKDSGRNNYPLF